MISKYISKTNKGKNYLAIVYLASVFDFSPTILRPIGESLDAFTRKYIGLENFDCLQQESPMTALNRRHHPIHA